MNHQRPHVERRPRIPHPRALFGVDLPRRHIRGLEEKICKVLAPISRAFSTAVETPPVVPR